MIPENPHIADRIDAVLTGARIPAHHRRWGEQLRDHLRQPVRVLVIGASDDDRAALASMLRRPAHAVTLRQAPVPTQGAMLRDLPQRADIVLWLSDRFDPEEQALWAFAPDTMRDRAFLVLTRPDPAVRGPALDWFRAAFHVPLGDGPATVARTDNGAAALGAALDRLIALGTEADLDQAQMFLAQFEPAAPPPQQPAPAAPATARPDARSVLDRADRLLDASGVTLETLARQQGATQAQLLDQCATTSRALVSCLAQAGPHAPALAAIEQAALQGDRMIARLQASGDTSAPLDAITVLVQLRKEILQATAAGF